MKKGVDSTGKVMQVITNHQPLKKRLVICNDEDTDGRARVSCSLLPNEYLITLLGIDITPLSPPPLQGLNIQPNCFPRLLQLNSTQFIKKWQPEG